MKNEKLIPVIIGIVGIGLGFVGGVQYQKVKGVRNFAQNFRGNLQELRNNRGRIMGNKDQGQNGMGQGIRKGDGMVVGEVTARDDKSITVKMNDGSSKIVILSDKTSYYMSSEAGLDKIEVGTKVATFGSSNSDGSVTATAIEINPMLWGQMNRVAPALQN